MAFWLVDNARFLIFSKRPAKRSKTRQWSVKNVIWALLLDIKDITTACKVLIKFLLQDGTTYGDLQKLNKNR